MELESAATFFSRAYGEAPLKDRPLLGYPHGDTELKVWCSWCCIWHTHGLTDAPGTTIHRSAHCFAPDSPHRKGGYLIFVTDTPWSTFKRRMKQATTRQQLNILDGKISEAVGKLRGQVPPGP